MASATKTHEKLSETITTEIASEFICLRIIPGYVFLPGLFGVGFLMRVLLDSYGYVDIVNRALGSSSVKLRR